MSAVLEVEALEVEIPLADGLLRPVRGVSFHIERGEVLGIVGESGCGKSLTSLALMGLLPPGARRSSKTLRLDGTDLSGLSERQMADVRGDRMSMIFQEPMTSLNPLLTIGEQLIEVFVRHAHGTRAEARGRALELLGKVGIAEAEKRLGQYPHQLSGGLRQRVMIAMALMCAPDLVIADEPTTALDVTIQAQVLSLFKRLQQELGLAVIFITHDLGVVARLADRVMVMYGGEIVESAAVVDLFANPTHPYTQGLFACLPRPGGPRRLGTIPGSVPAFMGEIAGCGFANRCRFVTSECRSSPISVRGTARHTYRCVHPQGWPAKAALEIVPMSAAIELVDLHHVYESRYGLLGRKSRFKAVSGISFAVERGGIFGVIGESGCGKSTLARLMVGLERPTSGEILISGSPLHSLSRLERARKIQIVFQDPNSSLNPRKSILSILTLPLRIHRLGGIREQRRRAAEMLDLVGLPSRILESLPRELSGGQRQRVAIGRALIMRPEIVVCDEPTSALDVSVQAQILNLLDDLRNDLGLTYILISHNLAVVEHMASRIAVMNAGRVVELDDTENIMSRPRHPYTRLLLGSILTPDPSLGLPQLEELARGPEATSRGVRNDGIYDGE